MCLAIPCKVIEIIEENGVKFAIAEYKGVRQKANLSLLENVKVGDYILIHAGYAIEVLPEKEAKESLELWEELLKKSGVL
ncbi:HypC/HybG/HupF family hydrogenase formation chaperone [Methanocaldococcus infernus]|uniref:Hydrogenase assembly chaperone hypC/hupF n=1 Tax=Methanocaldococcus infernus (strain DSM 11812 / JCM 15783 / ME) TaxID=573063 RepID=D5VRV2_METIM|nr:HypC/HybG/HupF family hydrogenase formation chaperone [Methanocaldococcus infernus]ADG13305.1 hydrogenase assembly chaperone hypC/hupF [Methanocaldococcus infernus ME]